MSHDEVEKDYEELKASLQCPICLDTFSKPVKILPCLHSFCSLCLDSVAESSLSSSSSSSSSLSSSSSSESCPSPLLSCPLCRQDFSLSSSGEGLALEPKDNLLVHSQLDRLDFLSAILDSDLSSSDSPLPSPSPVTFSPESQAQRLQAQELIEQARERRQEIETSLDLLTLVESDICDTSASQADFIISSLDDLVRKIDDHKDHLLKLLRESSAEKLARLGQQRKQLESDLDCLDNSIAVSLSIAKNATDDQFSFHLPQLTDQLTRLKHNKTFLQRPIEDKHLELVPISDNNAILNTLRLVPVLTESVAQAFKRAQLVSPIEFPKISTPSLVFGSLGQANGHLRSPQGATVDNENNIIVCDSENNRVQVFDIQGRFVRSFGGLGTSPGQMKFPQAVTTDSEGNIIVCDTNNHRVQIFDKHGKYLRSFGGQGSAGGLMKFPQAVSIDLHGNIAVCDTYNHRIQIFDKHGKYLRTFGFFGPKNGQLNMPLGLAIDKDNRFIVAEYGNSRIQILDSRGRHIKSFGERGQKDGQFMSFIKVAVDQQNNIIASDFGNHRIQVFDEHGVFNMSFGSQGSAKGLFESPRSVFVDHQNKIIVCDTGNHRIQMFGEP